MSTLKVNHVDQLVAQLERKTPNVFLLNANVIGRVEVPISHIPPCALYRKISKQRCLTVANHYIFDEVRINEYAGNWGDQRRLVGLDWLSNA